MPPGPCDCTQTTTLAEAKEKKEKKRKKWHIFQIEGHIHFESFCQSIFARADVMGMPNTMSTQSAVETAVKRGQQ